MINDKDEEYMREALKEAAKSSAADEVPVGAVIVHNGEIIARAHNLRETKKNALYHAEILAIDKACKVLGGWRLFECELYVTLEPCPMCAGAIVNSRIKRVVFGARDTKAGALGSVMNLHLYPLNHKPEIESGVCGEECGKILSEFFSEKRKKS